MSLVDAIRRAIKSSDQTRYRIAKGSGVSQAQLSRLMTGQATMTVANVERLANYLGMRVALLPKSKRKG